MRREIHYYTSKDIKECEKIIKKERDLLLYKWKQIGKK